MSRKPVLLDANLLVLLVVGLVSEPAIPKHKRTKRFSVSDFRLLKEYLNDAPKIAVTPNVVTEASNLLGKDDEGMTGRCRDRLKDLLDEWGETFIPSLVAALHPAYRRLGITDAALLHESFGEHELMTMDLDLYLAAGRLGRQAINFAYYIEANGSD
jgi:hypothetical protein